MSLTLQVEFVKSEYGGLGARVHQFSKGDSLRLYMRAMNINDTRTVSSFDVVSARGAGLVPISERAATGGRPATERWLRPLAGSMPDWFAVATSEGGGALQHRIVDSQEVQTWPGVEPTEYCCVALASRPGSIHWVTAVKLGSDWLSANDMGPSSGQALVPHCDFGTVVAETAKLSCVLLWVRRDLVEARMGALVA